jgi:hypothetical protein
MTAKSRDLVTKPCSGCMEDFTLDVDTGVITMRVPSNGKRGALHVPAHDVATEAVLAPDGVLVTWECPRCGYSESEYEDPAVRAEMT